MYGRFHWLFALLDVGGHVLKHHNGIVHNHADCYRKGGHRYDIQCVACSKEVNQRSQQGDRNREHDDNCGLPASEKEEHHQGNHQEGDDNRLDQSVDSVDNLGRRVVDDADLDVGRKSLLNLLELLLHIPDDIYRVCTRLLLNHDSGRAHSVRVGLLLPLLASVAQGGDIPEVNGIAVCRTHYHVKQLARVGKLFLHPEGVGLGTDVDVTRRDIFVLSRDYLGYTANAQPIRLEPCRVAVNLDFAGRSTCHRHGTHSGNSGKRGGEFIVEYLVKSGHTLAGRGGEEHNRHIVSAELENHRERSPVRKVGVDHIQLVADIVRGLLYVCSVLECKHQQGDILLGLRGELLEVLYAIERVLKDFCEVILYIPGVGSRVRGHNHNGICIKFRELRYRHLAQGENSQDGESDKYKSGRYRMFDAGAVNAHCATSTLSPTLREAWPLTTTLSPSLRPERISY